MGDHLARPAAHHAARVLAAIARADRLPCCTVAALGGGGALWGVKQATPVLGELTAAGLKTDVVLRRARTVSPTCGCHDGGHPSRHGQGGVSVASVATEKPSAGDASS